MRKIKKLLKLFHPKSFYLIVAKLYESIYSEKRNRTFVISEYIDKFDISSFVEIGVWKGDNILPLAKKHKSCTFYGVDPYAGDSFESYYKGEIMSVVDQSYYDNLYGEIQTKSKTLDNFKFIRKTSTEAAQEFEDCSLDMVFIDARHDYESAKKDILIWLPKVKKGGILSGHDYSLSFFGVVESVNELIGYDNVAIKTDRTWFYIKI